MQFHPVMNVGFLSGITLVSDCGCKGDDNRIVTMLYEKLLYIFKNAKSLHLKKLQII